MPEGASPYVLCVIAGGALFLLWLKLGALVGLREARADDRVAGYVAIAILVGGVLAVGAQLLWGVVGPRVVRVLGGSSEGSQLRLVWGAAGLPQVFVLLLLVPLDLVIVGPEVFTSERIDDAAATVWAALSVAAGVSLAAWSAFLFFRGVQAATGLDSVRSAVAMVIAAACTGSIVALLSLVAMNVGSS